MKRNRHKKPGALKASAKPHRHHNHAHSAKPAKLPVRKVTPSNLIAPEHAAAPNPPESLKTESTKAANRAARVRKLPHRVSIHELLIEARNTPNLSGAFADAEARRPISFSEMLHGFDLFD
jgi:hypothetical protein